MMGNCKDCRHWDSKEAESWEANGTGFRECQGVRERWRIADEASKTLDYQSDEDAYISARKNALKASLAWVEDGSEYRASLMTGPDFGCVLFDAPEAQSSETVSENGGILSVP